MNIVPRVNTPVTADEAKSAVANAFSSVFGRSPKADTELPYLMALVWLETGRGASVQNNNLGNITAGSQFNGDAWRPPWFEIDENTSERNKRLHEAMLSGQAPSAFRSYRSIDDGALDFTRQLQKSFPEVVEAAGTGNPEAFRDALAQKYSKDYKNTPPHTFESLAKEFGAKPFVPQPVVSKPRGFVSFRNVVLLGGLATAMYYGYKHFAKKEEPNKETPSEEPPKEPSNA